ncbi:YhdP family protein [Boseongicola aestuarii]|uniref:AsmA-like C-terminal domain-containing protein n=1 Tax=Boseongicola aestuarii TaxID=1470561 RepID=A0A238IWI5_9RHOB|nr:AsmA-like C-terminal region-containing protein [Boseongicola aestuarii]SMX22342.1 hypothetical protein BOA8489_00434 [Boseongicola aestuarii]
MSTDTEPETLPESGDAASNADRRARRTRAERRIARSHRHGRPGKGLVSTVILASIVLFLLGLVLSDRAVPVPKTLREEIAASLSERLPNASVRIGDVAVTLGRDLAPRVQMTNVSVGDTGGGGVAVLNRVSASLSMGALLRGRLAAEELDLVGAQVTVRRATDGTFAFRAAGGASGETLSLPDIVSALDATLNAGPLGLIQSVSAERVVLTLEDARSGRIWQATNASLRLRRLESGLTLSVSSDVFNGTDDVAGVQLSFSFDDPSRDIGVGMRLVDVPAADIADQSPILSWLGILDAPISGAVRAEYDGTDGLARLSGALEIAGGSLSPEGGTEPIGFETARAYFDFDPTRQRIEFNEIAVSSETLAAKATGHAYLTEIAGGWPEAFVGQFLVSDVAMNRPDVFEAPVSLPDAKVDLRLRLEPFAVDLAQIALAGDAATIRARGFVAAGEAGWSVSLDARTESIATATVLEFWPVIEAPVTRSWLKSNVKAGLLNDVTAAVRKAPGEKLELGLTFDFTGGEVQFLRDMPRIENASGRGVLQGKVFDLLMTGGGVTARTGDFVDIAGSAFRVPDIEQRPAMGEIEIRARGRVPALLSVTNNRPLRLMERAGRGIDLADGFGDVTARVTLPLKDGIDADEVAYGVTGQFSDVASDVIVPGRRLTSRALALLASEDEVRLTGPVALDGVGLTADWRQPLGEGARAAGSRITGRVALGPETAEAFGLALPDGLLRGQTRADYVLEVKPDAPLVLSLTSDLQGLGMRIDALNWEKAPGAPGGFEMLARLGDTPEVESLALSAPGLAMDGRLSLAADGRLTAAIFDQVRVGGWLDARARLTPRGPGQAPAISIEGGTLDFRAFPRGAISDGGGERAPMSVALDSFVLSDTVSFAPMEGQIDSGRAGLSGQFEARVNGRTPVRGTLAPANGGTAIRLQASDAGGVISAMGLTDNAAGGTLDIVLTPDVTAAAGSYRGEFLIEDIRIQNAPVMAALLDTISGVGLIDQLSGKGIRFATVDGRFRLTPNALVLEESAAVGGSLGISAAGLYDFGAKEIDMQGVVSPFFFLNSVGAIVSRRGEGLFGFNYRVTGPANGPTVGVNPLSILTPGLFREIFRRPPPTN